MDELLIEEVRNRTILYDLGHPDYKIIKKKKYAWREVAASVKLDEKECKKRWKGLRDSYKRCKRMEQLASGSSAETPKKSWRYLEALSFLDNVASSRSTVGNILKEDIAEHILPDIIEVDSVDSFMSTPSQSSTSLRGKKKNDSDKFQEFLDLPASSIAETCGAVTSEPKDSTALHFASLAAKIKEANMPASVVNKIEAQVSALVFAEMESFYSKETYTPLFPKTNHNKIIRLDELLIEEVRNRTILYDLGHPDYKIIKKKEYAWREVAASVKLDEKKCKKRWKGLRDSYKRCKRMEQLASGSSGETHKRSWRYLEALSFLDNVASSRSTVGNILKEDIAEHDLPDIIEVDSVDSFMSTPSQSSTSLRGKKKNDSD